MATDNSNDKPISIVVKNKETLLVVSYSSQGGQETKLEISRQQFTKISKITRNIPVLSKMLAQLLQTQKG